MLKPLLRREHGTLTPTLIKRTGRRLLAPAPAARKHSPAAGAEVSFLNYSLKMSSDPASVSVASAAGSESVGLSVASGSVVEVSSVVVPPKTSSSSDADSVAAAAGSAAGSAAAASAGSSVNGSDVAAAAAAGAAAAEGAAAAAGAVVLAPAAGCSQSPKPGSSAGAVLAPGVVAALAAVVRICAIS
jgi:hypothetical protein